MYLTGQFPQRSTGAVISTCSKFSGSTCSNPSAFDLSARSILLYEHVNIPKSCHSYSLLPLSQLLIPATMYKYYMYLNKQWRNYIFE
jgi:hypothetical protein